MTVEWKEYRKYETEVEFRAEAADLLLNCTPLMVRRGIGGTVTVYIAIDPESQRVA